MTLVGRSSTILLFLIAIGCEQRNSVLSSTNVRQKFTQIESMNRDRPGQMTLKDFEKVLGSSYPVSLKDPAFADLPPGTAPTPNLVWRHWNYNNEYLLVGFAGGHSASLSRISR